MKYKHSLAGYWISAFVVAFLLAGSASAQTDKTTAEDIRNIQRKRAAFMLVSRSMSDGKYDEAIKKYGEIVEEFPEETARIMVFRGEAHFLNGDMKSAVADFDSRIEIEPNAMPYLWQRGLALYYDGDYAVGQKQFEAHQKVNPQDVENAVWHFLCIAKEKGVEEAEASLIEIKADTRVPMKEIHQLYRGEASADDVLAAAQLPDDPEEAAKATYYGNLYIGLYFDATGDADKAREYLEAAVKESPYPAHVLMGQVARVHLSLMDQE